MFDKQVHKDIRTAIKDGNVEKVAALLDSDKDLLNVMTPFGTWLHVAASFGQFDIIKRLLELGADLNACGGTAGGGPLHRAASDGHLEVVRYLLGQGANLDVSEPERNPLFGAIHGGHREIVTALIDAGIDTSVRYTGESMKDMDAFAFAHERGELDIEHLL